MTNTYVQKEVSKVIKSYDFPQSMAFAASWIIAHFKGINLKIINAKESSALCDYNIIASAENTTQAKAMVDEIVKNLKEHGAELLSLEGMGDAQWILLDMGDIIIHIFQEVSREHFDLDTLWSGQEQLVIPSEFYFTKGEEVKTPEDSSSQYF